MSDNVVPFSKGERDLTPQELLKEIAEDETIEQVVVVIVRNGCVRPVWSKQTSMELSYASRILEWEVMEQISDAIYDE